MVVLSFILLLALSCQAQFFNQADLAFAPAATTNAVAAQQTLHDGVFAWWTLEPVVHTWPDSTTNKVDLTDSANDVVPDTTLIGFGADFYAGDSVLTNNGCADFSAADWAITGWVMLFDTNVYQVIADVASAVGEQIIFQFNTDQTLSFGLLNGSTLVWSTVKTNWGSGWYHVTLSYDHVGGTLSGGGITYVISGLATNTADMSYTPPGTPLSITLGGRYDLTSYFTGELDEWAIYGRKLSLDEINSLYNSGDGRAWPPP